MTQKLLCKYAGRNSEIFFSSKPEDILLKLQKEYSNIAIVCDANIKKLYGLGLKNKLKLKNEKLIAFPSGEKSKTFKTVEMILDKLLKLNFDRYSCLIALGGGVTGDIAGFAASLYMRGINLIQIPTSLLAQVDSSVGGKVGVNYLANHSLRKNFLGSFYQPNIIIINSDYLDKLNKMQYLSGLAEAIKYGIILDKDLFKLFEENKIKILNKDKKLLNEIIYRSINNKKMICENDQFEASNGKLSRKLLNYGHTFGHALEQIKIKNKIRHGFAVAYGMQIAALISNSLGYLSDFQMNRHNNLLYEYGLLKNIDLKTKALLLKEIGHDKKNKGNKITMALLKSIGHSFVKNDIPLSKLKNII
ncbi:MAG: 3-dehydroquinate synthase [Pseudomonadota bacterium]